ncbi:SERPIN domain-containing protein [Heracleum sosnowskyi]|uniref:SERPIN domain-containing protein n=1 Tax=Heracleum sosnowskyi TaxID=360622 RepID=A0AAD8I285_9APIA|nr:SERPIN domain-containing protein [Heracleum sosnowskyi]
MSQHSFLMEHVIKGDAKTLLDNQTDVSLNLAKHLLLNYANDSNLVFSPLSIQVILGLIAAGSGAQTLHQLLSFLKADSIHDLNHLYSHLVALVFDVGKDENKFPDSPCLSFANGVWLDESIPLKPPFKHVVDSLYCFSSV